MRASAIFFVILAFVIRPSANAAVIYSGPQNIPIPLNFTGVFLDLDTAATSTSTSAFTGWDINPFFGGIGISGSAAFQPARIGTANMDTILKFAANDLIDSSLLFSTGPNGSSDHLGAPFNFQDGVPGFLGFRYTTNSNTGTYYGWMRLTLTANTPGALIHDWAWENDGGPILAGSVLSIPEPSRAMLMMIGLSAAVFTRRRRS